MFAYGVCIGPSDSYERICRPSLPLAAVVSERRQQSSIFIAYNSILKEVTASSSLEAVVLLHDDVELGPAFEQDVRSRPHDRSWSHRDDRLSPPSVDRLVAGRDAGRAAETVRLFDHGGGTHDVDTVDGFIMVLSPDCARSVQFDEHTYFGFHAYDIDYCYEARRAGYRVVVAPLDVVHHTKGTLGDVIAYRQADLAWQRKWHLVPPYLLAVRRAKLNLVESRFRRSLWRRS